MRLLPLLALLILAQAASAQQTSEWLRMLENPKHSSDRLRPVNQIAKYSKFDFSKLLVPRSEFLGFIEPNYQRLKIYYDSVTRSRKDPNIYLVKGASIVRGNRCDFSGSIKVTQIREYRSLHYGVDDEHKNKGIKNQGVIIATFRFEEDPTQAHVGIFEL